MFISCNGTEVFKASYDAWGKQTITRKAPFSFYRGYTGHEHLPELGLINMNGRMYDPDVARFLSPDPYVQAPDLSQNFNRYSYCLNNPLIYTDPSGEILVPMLIAAGIGFGTGYVSYGITTNNWGMNAVYSGLMSAAATSASYVASGAAMGAAGEIAGMMTHFTTSGAWAYGGMSAVNTALSYITPPFSVPIGNSGFGVSISSGFGLGTNGLTVGANMSGTYTNGDFRLAAGIGAGTGYSGWNVSADINGWGGGWGQTSYSASTVMGQQLGSQTVGTATAMFNNNSLRWSNDAWGDREDRWRTNAMELNLGKWSIGTYLYTNFGKQDSPIGENGKKWNDTSAPWPVGKNRKGFGTWNNGRVYSAPLWIGYRKGNQITRFGWSGRGVQNWTQNLAHKTKLGSQHYYLNYDDFRSGPYFYRGCNNPFSLWDR